MATFELDPITRLSRDLADAAKLLTPTEARYLVDAYYTIQEYRKASDNQVRALNTSSEPHKVIDWLADQMESLESQVRRALDKWTDAQPLGVWAKSITGIGPVISAGLLAHIDITKAPTCGHIWRFAGLDPTVEWGKEQKRPWNARLKTLCWKIGESFVKVSGNAKDFYGKIYLERKAQEEAGNSALKFSAQATSALEKKKIGKDTEAYAALIQGRLPQAQIHARAKRYAVKMFLSHYHHVAYRLHYNEDPPKPFVIEHLGHAHVIKPPNF
jgi:hypothetical protein